MDNNCAEEETKALFHKTIKKVTEDLNGLRFNTCVSQLMIFTNHLSSLEILDKGILKTFLIILNPFAPHLTEELNNKFGYNDELSNNKWPEYDEKYILDDTIEIAVQINGKTRGSIKIDINNDQKSIEELIKRDIKLKKYLDGVIIKKVIYIKGRIINFVI